jgi:hypothetical protein
MAAVETDLYVALLAIGVEGEEARKLADNARRASDNVFYPILLVMLNRLAELQRWQTEFEEGLKRLKRTLETHDQQQDAPTIDKLTIALRAELAPFAYKLNMVPLLTSQLNALTDQISGLQASILAMETKQQPY